MCSIEAKKYKGDKVWMFVFTSVVFDLSGTIEILRRHKNGYIITIRTSTTGDELRHMNLYIDPNRLNIHDMTGKHHTYEVVYQTTVDELSTLFEQMKGIEV